MKDIRLIASDMDHTLLDSDGRLPPGFHDDLQRLADAGITFVAASGRPLFNLQRLFPPRGDAIAYVGDNGAILAVGDTMLFTSVLPLDAYHRMAAFTLERTPGVPLICGLDAAYVLAEHAVHDEYLHRFFDKVVYVDSMDDVSVDAVKVSAYFPEGNSRGWHDDLYAPAFGADFSVTTGSGVWVDVMNPGVHKGHALTVLADHLGIAPEQMMAFGDADNDVQMLDAVRYSYAVSNANDRVRAHARYAAGSNDDHGVATVIREVLAARARV